MSTEYLTERQALALFADNLIRFQEHRSRGLDIVQTAEALGITVDAAAVYERTISRLMADLKNEAAPVAPAAAPQKAHPDNHEGVNAP